MNFEVSLLSILTHVDTQQKNYVKAISDDSHFVSFLIFLVPRKEIVQLFSS